MSIGSGASSGGFDRSSSSRACSRSRHRFDWRAFSTASTSSVRVHRSSSTGSRGAMFGEFQCSRFRILSIVPLVVPTSRPIWKSLSSG